MEHVLLRCQIAVANANSKQKDFESKVFYYLSFLTQFEILTRYRVPNNYILLSISSFKHIITRTQRRNFNSE